MSEELLKGLMQLFAIATKQDGRVSETQRDYVQSFLLQQLDREGAKEYLFQFDEYAGYNKPVVEEPKPETEEPKRRRRGTSMKDSVRTLSICKKINATLTQKQKIVLLIRLLELVNADGMVTPLEKEIVDTVSLVFNFEKGEYKLIRKYVFESDIKDLDFEDILIINDQPEIDDKPQKQIDSNDPPQSEDLQQKHVCVKDLNGFLCILHVKSVDMYFVKYNGQDDLLMNGLGLNQGSIYLFSYGSTIKSPLCKPIYYSDVAATFLMDRTLSKVSFVAKDICFVFPGGNIGLDHVNLAENSGKLIAIMGASGAGKTTLLNVLAGIEKPTSGTIAINGIDIFEDKNKIEGVIGYVAQDDLLIEELSVFQNLYYNAKLCFDDLSEDEIQKLVVKVLGDLGLLERKDLKVGNALDKTISGGQRKRLNIALELIREPTVLFLDEPTSGLSSRDSENILDLLKELSSKGKLIFVVIHQPSSDIYKMFDKILILDVGGKPIYYDNPVEAVIYFKKAEKQLNAEKGQCPDCGNVNPELIFNIIESKVVDEYGKLTDKRKVSPQHWNELYGQNFPLVEIEEEKEMPPKTLKIPSMFQQLRIFITRDVLAKLSNTQYMLINLLEAPVLALILAFIIRYVEDTKTGIYKFSENDNIVAYLFMCIIVALFMGLTVSAEEIIRDRKILRREAFLNLSRLSYLFSKVVILFTISGVQTLSFVLIGNSILEISDMNMHYWMVLFAVSCFANMLGLNVSATFNSAVTIYILIPIILIPQMILSGAIFSFDKLNSLVGRKEKVPIIADMMASRWAYEALITDQFKNNGYEKYLYAMEKAESQADFKQVHLLPELKDKAVFLKKNINAFKDSIKAIVQNDLAILSFHFKQEMQITPIGFTQLNNLNLENYSRVVMDSSLEYIKKLNNFYTVTFNEINNKKEVFISSKQANQEAVKRFRQIKNKYHNENLADVVKNKTVKYRIIEENEKLVQLIDPIYMDPVNISGPLDYRSQFYAPNKHLFGRLWDTFYFNIFVILFITIVLFISLYFETFKWVIDVSSKVTKKLTSK